MFVVALTGGIGSGKTTVSERFAALGVPIVDTDLIARELVVPGAPALAAILEAFGQGLVGSDGALDRAELRRIAFADGLMRKRLEAILHPRIRERMLERLAAVDAPYAVVVIPLLFETGQTEFADRILVVDLPEAEQIRRVRTRSGLDTAQIRQILASQVTRAVRLASADDVIDNSANQAALGEQVERLHRHYLGLAASRRS